MHNIIYIYNIINNTTTILASRVSISMYAYCSMDIMILLLATS